MYTNLNINPTFPWTVSKNVAILHDIKLSNIFGCASVDIPKRIYKKGHGRNSHETTQYAAHGWADWCMYDSTNAVIEPYLQVKLELFNLVSILNACRIRWSKVNSVKDRLIDLLVEHSQLFPPVESTYALHEIVHICEQIPAIGPPYFNNLYQFERVNLHLKNMINNKNSGIASIVKCYAVSWLKYYIAIN